jgi:hypothetical protein
VEPAGHGHAPSACHKVFLDGQLIHNRGAFDNLTNPLSVRDVAIEVLHAGSANPGALLLTTRKEETNPLSRATR